jgi:uncharacterized RDD family membrane protein YckC
LPPPIDTVLQVETPEGLDIALRVAGAPARAAAFFLDSLIRLVLVIVASMLASATGVMGPAVFFVGFFLIEWFYPVVFELTLAGATPGKRAMGLQVVMESGLPVTPGASLLRNLLRGADFLPVFYAAGAVCTLVRRDFRRLGDLAAGTVVVHAREFSVKAPLPDATPRPPARALSLREQSAILAWAARSGTLTPDRLAELARLARPVLGEDVPAGGEVPALMGVAHWILGRREEVL